MQPFDLSLNKPENYFSLNDFLPDDGDLSKLIFIYISALDLANYLNPNKKLWVKIDKIFLEVRAKDVLELVPEAMPYLSNMTSDRIVSKLPIELCATLLTKLKEGIKFYKIRTSKITSCIKIHSKEASRDWASAVEDVRDHKQYLEDEYKNRHIRRILINFHDLDDTLNETLLESCLKKLDFNGDKNIEYEYNYEYNPSKYLIEKYIFFWPNATGCSEKD